MESIGTGTPARALTIICSRRRRRRRRRFYSKRAARCACDEIQTFLRRNNFIMISKFRTFCEWAANTQSHFSWQPIDSRRDECVPFEFIASLALMNYYSWAVPLSGIVFGCNAMHIFVNWLTDLWAVVTVPLLIAQCGTSSDGSSRLGAHRASEGEGDVRKARATVRTLPPSAVSAIRFSRSRSSNSFCQTNERSEQNSRRNR